MNAGIGWIAPSRLAPEASPFFAVPGGSLGELSDLMTEVPLNPRLAGLGCHGDRMCAPCASSDLDRNRRVNLSGLRGAQMAMPGQPVGWGLGEAQSSVEQAAVTNAVEIANTIISEVRYLAEQGQAIGGPGLFGGWSPAYEEQFSPLITTMNSLSRTYDKNKAAMPQDVRDTVTQSLTDLNKLLFAVRSGKYEQSSWDYLVATLRNIPAFVVPVLERIGEAVVEGTEQTFEDIVRYGKAAGEAVGGALDFGKYLVIGGLILFVALKASR
jgi:hypothetical protein